eukprot:752246-Prymnesium_polylepis.2
MARVRESAAAGECLTEGVPRSTAQVSGFTQRRTSACVPAPSAHQQRGVSQLPSRSSTKVKPHSRSHDAAASPPL